LLAAFAAEVKQWTKHYSYLTADIKLAPEVTISDKLFVVAVTVLKRGQCAK